MQSRSAMLLLLVPAAILSLSACAREAALPAPAAPASAPATRAAVTTEGAAPVGTPAIVASAMPVAIVHKSPTCGCCNAWIEHLRAAGFAVEVRETADLGPVKERLGVPHGMGSCHTAEIGGYVVEGHVPAGDIRRLLRERPRARGLVLPGMPIGSPGMEVPDGRVQPYTVQLVTPEGTTTAYSAHG